MASGLRRNAFAVSGVDGRCNDRIGMEVRGGRPGKDGTKHQERAMRLKDLGSQAVVLFNSTDVEEVGGELASKGIE